MELPLAFTNRMQAILEEDWIAFEAAMQGKASTSIRMNPKKLGTPPALVNVPWASHAYFLEDRPLFTADPRFHAGAYYVQEASSMFLEQAIKAWMPKKADVLALDLCAAPGGKSTHLLDLLPSTALLISNEVIKTRAHILAENLSKWGRANSLVTRNDPRDFADLPFGFDVIVVDAPCSGEGLFRKDEAATEQWSEDACSLCVGRQDRILRDIIPLLNEGGVLIYSTCTYNPDENEKLIYEIAEALALEVLSLPESILDYGLVEKTVSGKAIGYQCYPHRVQGEGFFIAGMRQQAQVTRPKVRKRQETWGKISKAFTNEVQAMLDPRAPCAVRMKDSSVAAWPEAWTSEIQLAYQYLHVVQAGVVIGDFIHGKFNPAASFALNERIQSHNYAQMEITREEALAYLCKNDFDHSSAKNGWVLLHYQGLNLGWIKKMGHRANNYWPAHWRIRMPLQEVLSRSNEDLF